MEKLVGGLSSDLDDDKTIEVADGTSLFLKSILTHFQFASANLCVIAFPNAPQPPTTITVFWLGEVATVLRKKSEVFVFIILFNMFETPKVLVMR